MARYIDADKFKRDLNQSLKGYRRLDEKCAVMNCIVELDEQPTADVVEVVRCRDCKHNVANWKHDELDGTDYTDIVCDYFMTDGMYPNDYCSYGERKEEL